MERFKTKRVGCAVDEEDFMIQKLLTAALITAALATAACNTVRGAARDVNSVANCTENTMEGHNC
jgi:predicted small secreted protein